MSVVNANNPAPVRAGSPATSYAAAATVVTGPQRLQVLELLRGSHPGGMTDDELRAEATNRGITLSRSGSSTRRNELVKMGMVADSGQTRLTPFGKQAVVWIITQTGLDQFVST